MLFWCKNWFPLSERKTRTNNKLSLWIPLWAAWEAKVHVLKCCVGSWFVLNITWRCFDFSFFIAILRRTSPVLYKTANQKIMRVFFTACGSRSPIWAASRSTSDVWPTVFTGRPKCPCTPANHLHIAVTIKLISHLIDSGWSPSPIHAVIEIWPRPSGGLSHLPAAICG